MDTDKTRQQLLIEIASLRQRLQLVEAIDAERQHTEYLLAAQSHLIEMLVRGRPLPEIFERLIHFMEAQSHGLYVSIMLLDDDGRSLRSIAAPSLPTELLREMARWPLNHHYGVCGTAVAEGEVVIVADLAQESRWPALLPLLTATYGLRAWWAIPILSSSRHILGVLALYAREPRHPSRRDYELIAMATYIAGAALERQQAQEALFASERKYQEIVSNIPGGVYQLLLKTDGSWTLQSMSVRASEFFGPIVEDILAAPETVWRYIVPEDIPRLTQSITEAARTMQTWRCEFRLRDVLPITVRWVQTVASPHRLPNGDILWHGVAFDSSADKRLAEEMLKIRNLESVSLLAGGIAHDFNNLLTVIGGNITLAKSYITPTSPALIRLVDAEQACRRSTALTDQLLTFSQGGSPVRQVASITELITESVAFALHGSKVHCAVTLAPDLWAVEVNAGQVHQVLHNILRNADQAMPHGGTLRVSAENVRLTAAAALPLAPGSYVKITVEDQGVGVPASHLTRIFEPYFTTKEYGSGLGLATSYAIVRNHGGHVTVTSQEGVGTTMSIYLPASHDALPPSARVDAEPVSGIGKVLLMDDDPAVRGLVMEMLQRLGYEVICANSGTEAIVLHQQAYDSGQPFDVLLLDLTVPGDLGAEATVTRILTCEAQVKAIVVSGYAHDPIVVDFRRYGFQGSLIKPYSIHELSARLRGVLQPEVGGQD